MTQNENEDCIDSLWDWYLAAISGGNTRSLINEITPLLTHHADSSVRREIYTVLLAEARRNNSVVLYRRVTADALEEFPEDVILYQGLSSVSLIMDGDPERALREIEQALALARAKRQFRRFCLGEFCRLGISLRNIDVWKRGLDEIMSLEINRGELDIGPERDLVENLPAEFASDPIVWRYISFVEKDFPK